MILQLTVNWLLRRTFQLTSLIQASSTLNQAEGRLLALQYPHTQRFPLPESEQGAPSQDPSHIFSLILLRLLMGRHGRDSQAREHEAWTIQSPLSSNLTPNRVRQTSEWASLGTPGLSQ